MIDREDTIAAVATPAGRGALSIVRVSGPRAREILAAVFAGGEWPARQVKYGKVRHGDLVVDDGMAWWAAGPETFTGEDVAEFTGHGGPHVTARVLEAFLAAGARPAEPGEFTRRAFLNGRMDLAEAEAVADVIAASTDDALRVARRQLEGGLSERIAAHREETLDALAHVEATVDFPDEDLHPDGNEVIAARFDAVAAAAETLAASFRRGRLLRDGARVVLAGRPNVGKSSLMNALSGTSRAIVTARPGTTRDTLEEGIEIGGIPVVLVDTAGMREVPDADGPGEAEAEGVRRSRAATASADLVLIVHDAAAGFEPEDREIVRAVMGRPGILIANKCDLAPPAPEGPWADGTEAADGGTLPALASLAAADALRVSARTGEGLDALKARIRECLQGGRAVDADDLVVTRARHAEALGEAARFLRAAAVAARRGESPDLIASDARRGLDALGAIVGAVSTEDLLGRIFERFCVGK